MARKMSRHIVTGFHAIEERVLRAKSGEGGLRIFYAKPGPRVKKILAAAQERNIPCERCDEKTLDELASRLSETAREHRGIVLCVAGETAGNIVNFDEWLSELGAAKQSKSAATERRDAAEQNGAGNEAAPQKRTTVLLLDSITDVHNIGAILRSCDQFGVSLVVLPQNRSAGDISNNETIARTSAGAAAWVPVSVVPNLVRAAQKLKSTGFWIYGADAGGGRIDKIDFAQKSALVMGSEGKGISRLLRETCDALVSIPTCGKIDSLNVSVAAGVLLYELHRRGL